MRDNNILSRFIKPAGRKFGFGFVNWLSLRTSRATWMIEAGANPKDVQGQMRHSPHPNHARHLRAVRS